MHRSRSRRLDHARPPAPAATLRAQGGEGRDRRSIALAADQMQMARAVLAAVAGKAGVRAALVVIRCFMPPNALPRPSE